MRFIESIATLQSPAPEDLRNHLADQRHGSFGAARNTRTAASTASTLALGATTLTITNTSATNLGGILYVGGGTGVYNITADATKGINTTLGVFSVAGTLQSQVNAGAVTCRVWVCNPILSPQVSGTSIDYPVSEVHSVRPMPVSSHDHATPNIWTVRGKIMSEVGQLWNWIMKEGSGSVQISEKSPGTFSPRFMQN